MSSTRASVLPAEDLPRKGAELTVSLQAVGAITLFVDDPERSTVSQELSEPDPGHA